MQYGDYLPLEPGDNFDDAADLLADQAKRTIQDIMDSGQVPEGSSFTLGWKFRVITPEDKAHIRWMAEKEGVI